MFRAFVLIVVIAIFAKPAYEWATSFIVSAPEAIIVETEVAAQPDALQATQQVQNSMTTSSPAKQELADKINSLETLTDAFYYYFSRYETDFTINYNGNTANLESMMNEAIDIALARDTYVAGHLSMREISYEYNKVAATIHVRQTYLTNLQQEQVVDAKIQSLVSTLPVQSMNDFQKVKFVNDYIVQNTQYSDATATSAHSAFTLVQEGKAVCQGYALFATKLLRALGIEAMYVTGEVFSGGHAWNLVKVDGEWYHLDTTWNDPVPDRGSGIRYDYFLTNDEQLARDHVWERSNYPRATSNAYAFMHVVQDSYEKDGYMYYSNSAADNTLYRLHMQTGINEQVTNIRALYVVGAGNKLYFSNYSNGGYLTEVNIDGTGERVLIKEKVSNLFVEGGYIYFYANNQQQKIAIP